jgi:hypothetical protein
MTSLTSLALVGPIRGDVLVKDMPCKNNVELLRDTHTRTHMALHAHTAHQ